MEQILFEKLISLLIGSESFNGIGITIVLLLIFRSLRKINKKLDKLDSDYEKRFKIIEYRVRQNTEHRQLNAGNKKL